MPATTVPYGFWPSDWSAQNAAAASEDFAELRAGHGGLVWLQYHPDQGRCALWYWREGQAQCLTPPDVSVRSRVYEYGGGAFCLTADGIAFVNEQDQQIYLQTSPGVQVNGEDENLQPIALTARANCRYGDLQHDPHADAILAVEELHDDAGVQHRLVSFARSDGRRRVLAEGADFYASPTLSPDGHRLAWIEWRRPEQPWTSTSLWVAERSGARDWQLPRCLAGAEGGESLQQPRFAEGGELHCLSDRHGWWQPWREQDGVLVPVNHTPQSDSDHAPAPWQLGTTSYLPLEDDGILLTRIINGYSLLFEQHGKGDERQLAVEFTRCRQLTADEQRFYCIAGSPSHVAAILAIDRVTGETTILAGGEQPLPPEQLSRPEALGFVTGDSESAHAFFYPPTNAEHIGLPEEQPPLVVFLHGGPTSASYPVFDPRIQFWTQRGFAVVDVNYRGSSGFGREYRQRLREQWGVVDVQDVCAAVRALVADGRIDPERTFVRGGSAGGYTALCALIADSRFLGGASLYGVSDPWALREATHKFEGDYLDWLIGNPVIDPERYRQRAPLHNAQRIKVPVIFFQGGLDAVVLPAQTEAMVAALRTRDITVEYHLYPNERHGFREAQNIADALERECGFYQQLLNDARPSAIDL